MSNHTGLRIIKVPDQSIRNAPGFLQFPGGLACVSVGNNPGACTISLSDWDFKSKKQGLYSPHVEFRYSPMPLSTWMILSLRGFRRGSKQVIVDGEHISSANSLVPIHHESLIHLGGFEFLFWHNRRNDIAFLEDPKSLIAAIEKIFKMLTIEFNLRFPNELVDAKINAVKWTEVYLSHYIKLLLENDTIIAEVLVSIFGSKTKAKMMLRRLITLRNQAFHPSKGDVSMDDRNTLAEVFIKIEDASNKALQLTR